MPNRIRDILLPVSDALSDLEQYEDHRRLSDALDALKEATAIAPRRSDRRRIASALLHIGFIRLSEGHAMMIAHIREAQSELRAIRDQ